MEMRVFLKVCEGCGCLWYRAQFEVRVYCEACSERLKEFPTAESRKRRGRPRKVVLSTVLAVDADLDEPGGDYGLDWGEDGGPGSPRFGGLGGGAGLVGGGY